MKDNIFDLNKIKKQKQQEVDDFTYAGYVEGLEEMRSCFHLVSQEDQLAIFDQTAHLLIEIIKTAIHNSDGELK